MKYTLCLGAEFTRAGNSLTSCWNPEEGLRPGPLPYQSHHLLRPPHHVLHRISSCHASLDRMVVGSFYTVMPIVNAGKSQAVSSNLLLVVVAVHTRPVGMLPGPG